MFDVSELNTFITELERSVPVTDKGVRAATQKGSANVKRDARTFSSGIGHAPLYPASIGYETIVRAGSVEGVIGPDKDKPQGALGNILEYGTSKNAPLAHLGPALDLEAPRYEKAIADTAEPW